MSHPQALNGLLHDMTQLNGSGCVSSLIEQESFSMSIMCPKSMVGRVIGKGGETIKALQQYTSAMIQIDQSQDPTRVTIVGKRTSMETAASMVKDIVEGNFKGFAMLRQMTLAQSDKALPGWESAVKSQPVYIQGYGFVPPSQYVDEDAKAAAMALGDPSVFAPKHLSQADPLSPMFQHGMSAAQLNALAGNGALLSNANMLKNASLGYPPSIGVKALNGIPPLSAGVDVNGAKTPATRRLFNGVPINANGCSTATAMPMQQQERAPSPGSDAAAAAASAGQPSAMYRSAPTSPNTAAAEAQQLGASVFDFRSAPTSPSSAAFSINTNGGSLPGYQQRSGGVGALTNSLSFLDLGGIREESAESNRNIFGQPCQQDQFLDASAGINGMTPEEARAMQAINARLGLDSSLGMFAMGGGNSARGGPQSLDGGPRSVSMGALGQRHAFFGGSNGISSFGTSAAAASQAAAAHQQSMTHAMTQAMLGQLAATNQMAAADGRGTPTAAAAGNEEAAAQLQAAAQELAKSSPASSYSSTSSLFASGGASPKLPPNWMQLKDPEGRHFFMNMTTAQTQWDFPTA